MRRISETCGACSGREAGWLCPPQLPDHKHHQLYDAVSALETPTAALLYWAESLWRCATFAKCCLELGWGGKPLSLRLTRIQCAVPCLQLFQEKISCTCRHGGVCLLGFVGKSLPWLCPYTEAEGWGALSQGTVLMLSLNESPASVSIYGMSKSPITMAAKHREIAETGADQPAAPVRHNHRAGCHILPWLLPWPS